MSVDFSVIKGWAAAVSFLPKAWTDAWLALMLLFAVIAGGPLLLAGHYVPSPIAPLVLILGLLFMALISQGALYRIALFGKAAKEEGLGFGGVQIARAELRLFLAFLIMAAFVILVAAAICLVFAIALNMSGLTTGYDNSMAAVSAIWQRHSGADYVFILYIIAGVLFLLFVGLKFALMPAANISGRKLVTLNALGLSAGRVGRLFIGLIGITVPFALAAGFACALGLRYDTGRTFISLYNALFALVIFGLLPLIVGFLASAYRQIMAIRSK